MPTDPFEAVVRKAAAEARLTVLERRWMFGPGYDRNGEAMADAVAKAVLRVLRGHKPANQGNSESLKAGHGPRPGGSPPGGCMMKEEKMAATACNGCRVGNHAVCADWPSKLRCPCPCVKDESSVANQERVP